MHVEKLFLDFFLYVHSIYIFVIVCHIFSIAMERSKF